jgi:Do/DeqQ family serine protease
MNIKKTAVGSAVLLAFGGALIALDAPKDKEAAKVKPDEFLAKLKRDATPLPANGQLLMSYSSVVDKILPSLVRITPSVRVGGGGMAGQGRDLEQLPPEFREFFRRFYGVPEDFGSDEPAPRRSPRNNEPRGELRRGTGSGVIISSDGYILTNNHVIEDAEKIEVAVGREEKNYVAKLIGADPRTDVALLKIEGTGLPAAVIGDSSKLRVGDVVLAAGSPMELSQSVTQGIVSALSRRGIGLPTSGGAGIQDFIQTDASINPGNSGGPLIDATGRVVGINTAILSRSGMNAGIGFSIPINLALSIVEDLIDDGKVSRGFLGITMENMREGYGKMLGLESDYGVFVKAVSPDSPAEKSGIEPGDVVVGAAGQKVEDNISLGSIVGVSKPGTKIPLDIYRDGKRMTITATLESISDEELMSGTRRSNSADEKVKKASPAEMIDGVVVAEISPALRQRYDIPDGLSGVVVVKVEPNSLAGGAGVEEGDVITSINTTKLTTLADVNKVEELQSGEPVFLKINRGGKKETIIIPGEEQ